MTAPSPLADPVVRVLLPRTATGDYDTAERVHARDPARAERLAVKTSFATSMSPRMFVGVVLHLVSSGAPLMTRRVVSER